MSKRKRRTKAEMNRIRDAIVNVVAEHHPMTVRQVFYQMAVRGVVPKQESKGYNTVQRLLVEMRRDGVIPYNHIADSSRTIREPDSFDDLRSALQDAARTYRRSLWTSQPVYIQVWLEKEALAGVLWDVTDEWDVPLWVSRGYTSLSYLYQASKRVWHALESGRDVYIYNVGDHDPSGVNAWESLQNTFHEWIPPTHYLKFERVAVTPEQIEAWDLPSRPTKQSDTRAATWNGGESVEVDAIPPRMLTSLVRKTIEQHIPLHELEMIQQIEEQERDTLKEFAELWE